MTNIRRFVWRRFPSVRHIDLDGGFNTFFNSGIVHVNDFLAFGAIVVNHCLLQVFDGFGHGNDFGQFEEG